MSIFILWVMLTSPKGITLESQEYTSFDTCTKAEAVLHQKLAKSSDWNDPSVYVITSCTEK